MVKKLPLETWLHPNSEDVPVPVMACLFTDEPLFKSQATDLFRRRLRQKTEYQRQVIETDRSFDAQAFLAQLSEVSLFGDVNLVELRMSQPKASKDLAAALNQASQWFAQNQCEHFLLITGPKLNKTQEKAAGIADVLQTATEIVCKAINADNMSSWLSQSASRLGLKLDPNACQWLVERTEGNLLSAHQTLEKLAVEHQGAVNLETVAHVASDAARYNAFDLGPCVLAGDHKRTVRMIEGLCAEGESSVLALWALMEEIRALRDIRRAMQKGMTMADACRQSRVWGQRQKYIAQALKRHNGASLEELTNWCYVAEKTIKGLHKADAWTLLEMIGLGIGGIQPPAPLGNLAA